MERRRLINEGWRCGTIEATDETLNYTGAGLVDDLIRTNACSDVGDSGGPLLDGRLALGVLSGGVHFCGEAGALSWFQPVAEILEGTDSGSSRASRQARVAEGRRARGHVGCDCSYSARRVSEHDVASLRSSPHQLWEL